MRVHNILVVNGTGFIGSLVVRALATDGHRVTVLHRGEHAIEAVAGVSEVCSPHAAIPVLRYSQSVTKRHWDAVVLMVPLGVSDAEAAVTAFGDSADRIVAVSSADVYASYGALIGCVEPQATSAPLREDSPLREKLFPYGPRAPSPWGGELLDYDKILVERAVLANGNGVVLRLPAVYGPRDNQRRFAKWLHRMLIQRPHILLGDEQADWRWTHGYVYDVAAAISLATTHKDATGRIYNVGECLTPTVHQRLRFCADILGWRGRIVIVPEAEIPSHLRAAISYANDLVLDTTRIREELGFHETVRPEEALRHTIDWERSHPLELLPEDSEYAREDEVATLAEWRLFPR